MSDWGQKLEAQRGEVVLALKTSVVLRLQDEEIRIAPVNSYMLEDRRGNLRDAEVIHDSRVQYNLNCLIGVPGHLLFTLRVARA